MNVVNQNYQLKYAIDRNKREKKKTQKNKKTHVRKKVELNLVTSYRRLILDK